MKLEIYYLHITDCLHSLGYDLKGNTYWEFPDTQRMGPARVRRIVKYQQGAHFNVNVPPMWHQWLRHQRSRPPSIREQQMEVTRQENIKILAAQAKARWEAKRLVGEEIENQYGSRTSEHRLSSSKSSNRQAPPDINEDWEPAQWVSNSTKKN